MPLVATVGEVEIGVDDFISECMHEDSALMRQALERLVLSRLVKLETERMGVVLGEERLATAQAAALGQVAEQVEESTPGMSLDDWISTRLGLDPVEFKGRIRERVEIQSSRLIPGVLSSTCSATCPSAAACAVASLSSPRTTPIRSVSSFTRRLRTRRSRAWRMSAESSCMHSLMKSSTPISTSPTVATRGILASTTIGVGVRRGPA
jgi:hypothetical protein